MLRSAPKGGYDFGAKRQYRREVWASLARLCPVSRRTADVLLMPSAEGAEIPIALAKGFAELRIHAIDENAAIIATAAWRSDYPAINKYGNELGRACERIAAKGVKLAVANLDLCSNVSVGLLRTLKRVGRSGVFADDAVIALTLLRGREAHEVGDAVLTNDGPVIRYDATTNALLGGLRIRFDGPYSASARDVMRLVSAAGVLACAGGFHLRFDRMSIYRSSASTMLWAVASLSKNPDARPDVRALKAQTEREARAANERLDRLTARRHSMKVDAELKNLNQLCDRLKARCREYGWFLPSRGESWCDE